jgi:MFS family permease
MAEQLPRRLDLMPLAAALAAFLIGVASAPFFVNLPDDRLIVARYAAQLRDVGQLVFNRGEPFLLIAAPLPILAQALLGAELLFALSMALGAACLYELAEHVALTSAFRLLAAGIFALAYPLWIGAGSPYPLMTALALLGLLLAQRGRWRWSGAAFALTALCGIEALALVALMALYAAQQDSALRFTLTFAALLSASFLALWLHYSGAPFWEGLLIVQRGAPPSEDLFSAPILALLIAAALPIWWMARREPFVALLGAWIALYSGIWGGIFRLEGGYTYALIVPAAALLASRLCQRAPIMSMFGIGVAVITCIAVLSGALARYEAPVPFPTSPEADSIAVPNKDALFRQAWRLDQQLIALDGTLQPELRRLIERGDLHSALVRYAPDMLNLAFADDDWCYTDAFAALGYVPYQSDRTFQRTADVAPFSGRLYVPDQALSADLHLHTIALAAPRRADQPVVRFRVRWRVAQPASRPIAVEIALGASSRRTEFPAAVFGAGTFDTYHALPIPAELLKGSALLRVRVIVNNGTLGEVLLQSVDLSGVSD